MAWVSERGYGTTQRPLPLHSQLGPRPGGPGLLRQLAMRAMREIRTDIAGQEKTSDRYLDRPFDAVIIVCDQASGACPVFLGAR